MTDHSFDGVLLSYVLHHVQDIDLVLSEVRRVVRNGGLVVVYEDIPKDWRDRFPCWTHDLKWRRRTGPCTFRRTPEWQALFSSYGLEIVSENHLSRWRNVFHPIGHTLYVLKANGTGKGPKRVAQANSNKAVLAGARVSDN